ncbi:MAG: orotidine-5'-phosphate decarboxylase [Bacteroidetes bacterium]|nr:orotidine-5'-phosphate decarboxylase [Bacteroidota bacterium]
MESHFTERLRSAQAACDSMVCVGLDPDVAKLPDSLRQKYARPEAAILAFNNAIIQATAPYACAYKLNAAFYENLGSDGFRTLAATIDLLPSNTLCIVDAKRGDIGNTARSYASSIFNLLGADGCTVAPYMGFDAVQPFLEYPGRATFVLVRTSNPSSDELQSLILDGKPLYEHVANRAVTWGKNFPGSVGFVVGATKPQELQRLRDQHPTIPFLIPGIGAQGGPVEAAACAATPKGMILVNSSRGILYASPDENFDKMAAKAARELRDALNQTNS